MVWADINEELVDCSVSGCGSARATESPMNLRSARLAVEHDRLRDYRLSDGAVHRHERISHAHAADQFPSRQSPQAVDNAGNDEQEKQKQFNGEAPRCVALGLAEASTARADHLSFWHEGPSLILPLVCGSRWIRLTRKYLTTTLMTRALEMRENVKGSLLDG